MTRFLDSLLIETYTFGQEQASESEFKAALDYVASGAEVSQEGFRALYQAAGRRRRWDELGQAMRARDR